MPTPIPRTILATSDPIDICEGFALFPAMGTVRAGVSDRKTLFNERGGGPGFDYDCSFGYSFFAGMCGPAYAVRFQAQGETDRDRIFLEVSEDELAAGFVFGCNLGISLDFQIDTAFGNVNFPLSLTIDLIEELVSLIMELLSSRSRGRGQQSVLQKQDQKTDRELLGSWGIYDEASDQFGETGKLRVDPTFSLPINLLDLIPALKPVNNALGKIGGELAAGPTLGISIPIDVEAIEFTLHADRGGTLVDDVGLPNPRGRVYRTPEFDGGRLAGIEKFGRLDTQEGGYRPSFLAAKLIHSPAFDLRLGVFAELTVAKLFSLGASFDFPLLETLGFRISLGSFTNRLENAVGASRAAADPGEGVLTAADLQPTPVEVVFELQGRPA